MTDTKGAASDPKGLIRESYAIEGIGPEECRSVFLDWALSLPDGVQPQPYIARLIEHYGPEFKDHPMTQVLRDALSHSAVPARRGGHAGRTRAAQDGEG